MSKPSAGYMVKLVYHGPADLNENWEGKTDNIQVSTQNIRMVSFSASHEDGASEDFIAIYELVKNETQEPEQSVKGATI